MLARNLSFHSMKLIDSALIFDRSSRDCRLIDVRGRARGIVFGLMPVIQAPKRGRLESCAMNSLTMNGLS